MCTWCKTVDKGIGVCELKWQCHFTETLNHICKVWIATGYPTLRYSSRSVNIFFPFIQSRLSQWFRPTTDHSPSPYISPRLAEQLVVLLQMLQRSQQSHGRRCGPLQHETGSFASHHGRFSSKQKVEKFLPPAPAWRCWWLHSLTASLLSVSALNCFFFPNIFTLTSNSPSHCVFLPLPSLLLLLPSSFCSRSALHGDGFLYLEHEVPQS